MLPDATEISKGIQANCDEEIKVEIIPFDPKNPNKCSSQLIGVLPSRVELLTDDFEGKGEYLISKNGNIIEITFEINHSEI